MNGGIDQLVAQRMGSAGGNPQALQQQYKQSGDIVTLIAMQKMKTDLERKAQETQLQMQTTPQTIAQQREQEVLGLTKQEVSQQLQPGIQQMGQQMAQAQQAPQGPPQGIASVPRPPMGMAAGGIVAFQEGGNIDPRAMLDGSSTRTWEAKIADALSKGAEIADIVASLKGNPDGLRALAELTSGNDNTPADGSGMTTTRIPREPRRIYGDELPVVPPEEQGEMAANPLLGAMDIVPYGKIAESGGDKVSSAMDWVSEQLGGEYSNTKKAALEQASKIKAAEEKYGPVGRAGAGILSLGSLAAGLGKDAAGRYLAGADKLPGISGDIGGALQSLAGVSQSTPEPDFRAEFPATPDLPPEPDAKEAAIEGSGIGAVANAQGTPSEQGTRRSDLYKWLGDKRNASAADAQARAEGNFSKHTAGSRGIAELLARREQQMQDAITKQQDPETLRRNKLKATLLGMGSSNSQYASNAFARGLAGSMNEQSRQDKDQLGGIATLNKMAGDRMDKLRPLEEGVFNAGQSAYDTTNDNAYKNALTEAQMSNADQVAIGQAEENRLRALAADLTKQGMVDGKTDTAIRGAFGELEKINNRVSDKLAEDGEYIAANAEMQRGIEEGGKSGQKRIDKAVARIVDAKRRVQEMEGYAPAVSKIENWLKTLYTRSGVPQPPESAAPLQGATMKQIQ